VRGLAQTIDGRHALSGGADGTVRLWDLDRARCLAVLGSHELPVSSVAVSHDARYAVSGARDATLRMWELDWELEEPEPGGWEGARPHLESFLRAHTPCAAPLHGGELTEDELRRCLLRAGTPVWSDGDFDALLRTLGGAGYGRLDPGEVRATLVRLAAGGLAAARPPLRR
jgi:hypothetical protein